MSKTQEYVVAAAGVLGCLIAILLAPLSVVLVAFGLMLLLVVFLFIRRRNERAKREDVKRSITQLSASAALVPVPLTDLDDIANLAESLVPEVTINRTLLAASLAIEPRTVRVLRYPDDNPMDRKGVLALYPLSGDGDERLRNGSVKRAAHLRATELAESFEESTAIYFSWIAASGLLAQGDLHRLFAEEIRVLARSGVQRLWGRPSTLEGEALAERLGAELARVDIGKA